MFRTQRQPPIKTGGTTPKTKQTLGDDIDDFVLERRTRRVKPQTIEWYQDALNRFHQFCQDNSCIYTTEITPRMLRAYLDFLTQRGHNDGGISHLYRPVRACLRWVADEYNLPHVLDALRKVPGPVPSPEPLDPIPLEHVKAMLAQCPHNTYTGDRDRAMILVLLDTGIRHQELTDLTVDDLNLNEGSILIREGKGGKSRTVFVGLKTRRALTNYLRLRESPQLTILRKRRHGTPAPNALWLTDEGTPLTKRGIRQIIVRRSAQAGLPEPGMHEFRRAFAINSLRNGMDVITLQRLLGHSSLTIINRYLKLLSDDLRLAHERYGVVDRL